MTTGMRHWLEGEGKKVAERIRTTAHDIHALVNQHYDTTLPYGFHLDMVAEAVINLGDSIIANPDDYLPVYFGAMFHDSIEDARLTYNNVLAIAGKFMTAKQALMAAEIVYALTNEKGRTRSERADERYYSGIRVTPYAPMVKLADRIANMTYSATHRGKANDSMRNVYATEFSHFIESITVIEPSDPRLNLPAVMVEHAKKIAHQNI